MVSKRRELIQRWFDGYRDWTPGSCAAYRTPDCPHVVVGVHAPTPWSPEETTWFFEQWDGISKSATFEVHDWLEDEEENKVAIWVSLHQTFQDHLDIMPYNGTYAMIFFFNETQDRFTKFVEFVDNENTANILGKVNSARAKLSKGPLEYPKGTALCDTKY